MDKYGAREFELKFRINNAAFEGDDMRPAIQDVLRGIGRLVRNEHHSGIVYDVNGNVIGNWSIDLPEDEEEDDE